VSLPTPYWILPDAYEKSGSVSSGLSATVGYRVPWANADAFAAAALACPSASHIGGIVWQVPYQFPEPFAGATTFLYCQGFRIKPYAPNGQAILVDSVNPGLACGDFFEYAIVTLNFSTIQFLQQLSDDPQGLNQLDSENPITGCEQSVDINGKVVTVSGAGYTYTSTSTSGSSSTFVGMPVKGDIDINQNEVKLMLRFPRVPYLPWQLVQPYVGKINSSAVLQCGMGTLLLEGMTTVIGPQPNGTLGQNIALKFAFNPDPTSTTTQGLDWNAYPLPDGSGYAKISPEPYTYANFSNIFTGLQF
jgi:hypothetical protein